MCIEFVVAQHLDQLVVLIRYRSAFDNFSGASSTVTAQWYKFLSFDLIVRDKEVFNLVQQILIQMFERVDITVGERIRRNCYQSIISVRFAILSLIGFNHA